MRELDAAYLRQVDSVRGEFFQRLQPHDRPVIAGHRAAVAGILGEAQRPGHRRAGTSAC